MRKKLYRVLPILAIIMVLGIIYATKHGISGPVPSDASTSEREEFSIRLYDSPGERGIYDFYLYGDTLYLTMPVGHETMKKALTELEIDTIKQLVPPDLGMPTFEFNCSTADYTVYLIVNKKLVYYGYNPGCLERFYVVANLLSNFYRHFGYEHY